MKNVMLILSFVLVGCHHESELKTEKGIVFDKSYSPAFDDTSTGVGMSTGGKTVITTSHVHQDEKWIVIFKCEHGDVFAVESKDLYINLSQNDSVDIDFKEILNSDNEVVDFNFIYARKRQ